MEDKIKYAHLGQDFGRRATIGYRRNWNDDTVTYAIAVCNERDRFNKARGRQIVEGRIIKSGTKANGVPRSYTMPITKDAKYGDIIEQIVHRHQD